MRFSVDRVIINGNRLRYSNVKRINKPKQKIDFYVVAYHHNIKSKLFQINLLEYRSKENKCRYISLVRSLNIESFFVSHSRQ